MYQQRAKLNLISMVALGLTLFFGVIALAKNVFILVLFALCCIAISIICEGLLSILNFNKQVAARLLLLGILLFILTVFLLFHYLKSN